MNGSRRHPLQLVLVALCLALTACGTRNTDDLKAYVAQVRARVPPPVKPPSEVSGYTPYAYRAHSQRSPFATSEKKKSTSRANGIHPDRGRPPDPLEHYPLDALQMVGTLTAGGTIYGLVTASDHVVHRVQSGDHMGHHYGRINNIGRDGILLTEILPNGNGGYKQRSAALRPTK
jgi:type IV pilus assembly protein PilP